MLEARPAQHRMNRMTHLKFSLGLEHEHRHYLMEEVLCLLGIHRDILEDG